MAISATRRGGQAEDVTGPDLAQDALEGYCRHMVAFVHDHVAVPGHDIIHAIASDEALHHGDVQPAVGLVLAGSNLADLSRLQVQKRRELRDPLFQKLGTVDHHQGIAATTGHDVGANHGLSGSRRRHEDPEIVLHECLDGLLLDLA